MIEFRNGFSYYNRNIFNILPAIAVRHNKLNNYHTVNIELFRWGYTFTIGKRRK